MHAKSTQSFLRPMDCSHPGSWVHGILQARILELVSIPFSRGSSRPIKLRSFRSLAMIGRFFTTVPPEKPPQLSKKNKILTFENMDWLGGHYAQWNKSDREREMLYVFTYMWNLKIKIVISMMVQWLRLWVRNAGGPDSIPGQRTRSHKLQLKGNHIPHLRSDAAR